MKPVRLWGNDYNRMELAGAFGDLGTLIPFVVGYITLNKMDPVGILVAFGLFKIFTGLYFRTPVPVQPMKAIGGMAIAHAATVTQGMIWGSGIFTGFFWLLMGATGAVTWIHKITTKPVVRGIMLGLGLSFMVQGLNMMKQEPLLAIGAAILALLLLNSRRYPAMLILLAYGVVLALIQKPALLADLSHISVGFRLPTWGSRACRGARSLPGASSWGFPKLPHSGQCGHRHRCQNNQYFPDRPVTARQVSIHHGVMNLIAACIGGIPMCHGAGGMAGHIRFGARTGGALVMLGLMVLFTGLFLGDSVSVIFQFFPSSVLGVILFFAGVELALVVRDVRLKRQNLFVLLVTGGIAMWNMGVAYLAGLLLYYALNRRWIKV